MKLKHEISAKENRDGELAIKKEFTFDLYYCCKEDMEDHLLKSSEFDKDILKVTFKHYKKYIKAVTIGGKPFSPYPYSLEK